MSVEILMHYLLLRCFCTYSTGFSCPSPDMFIPQEPCVVEPDAEQSRPPAARVELESVGGQVLSDAVYLLLSLLRQVRADEKIFLWLAEW